ncbi:hypothetical protein JW865_00615 [Candidatus Bathyarchaeota archaeon]|nr:hypothetical protein [Candidatus Bathyarchaeota archaeon]
MAKENIGDACPFPPGLDPSKNRILNTPSPKFNVDLKIILAIFFAFTLFMIGLGYSTNIFIPKDKRLEIEIIEGTNYQSIYDDNFTASYNYTYLLNKVVRFTYFPGIEDYSTNGSNVDSRHFLFQNISDVEVMLDSLKIPNVVKGVAKTVLSMSASEAKSAIKPMQLLKLGDSRFFYYYIISRSRVSDGVDRFSLHFVNSKHSEEIWCISVAWIEGVPSYKVNMTFYLEKPLFLFNFPVFFDDTYF